MDAATRALVRRRVSDERRRRTGAQLGQDGATDIQAASGTQGLAQIAFEACDGDPLLALDFALEVLAARSQAEAA